MFDDSKYSTHNVLFGDKRKEEKSKFSEKLLE
jgi:hypothetical protein